MSDQNHAPRFGCPQCGSERIDEQNLIPFHYPVTAWTEDGEPAGYGERREIEGGTKVEEIPYWCNDCYHIFQRPVRLDVDPDAEEKATMRSMHVPPPGILYAGATLDDGRRVQFFLNRKTNLIVVDVIDADDSGGVEILRRTV